MGIRKKMSEIITREVTSNDMKEVVNKLIPDSIGKDIEKSCQGIYPMHDVLIHKVGTFSGVTLGSAEAFAVEDSKALLNGLWLHHESGDPGHDVRAVVAGPVAEAALHLAESKL